MIVVVLFFVLVVASSVARWQRAVIRRRRYERCLSNIKSLERLLFPEWFPAGDEVEWIDMAHGTVWEVDSHDDIIMSKMVSRGLLGSGEFDAQQMLQRYAAMSGS